MDSLFCSRIHTTGFHGVIESFLDSGFGKSYNIINSNELIEDKDTSRSIFSKIVHLTVLIALNIFTLIALGIRSLCRRKLIPTISIESPKISNIIPQDPNPALPKRISSTANTIIIDPYEKAMALIKIAKSQVTRDFGNPFINLSSDEGTEAGIETLAEAIEIAQNLAIVRKSNKAKEIFKEATAAADTFKYLPGRVEVLCKIAIAQWEIRLWGINDIGDVNPSKATFKKAKEAASSISNQYLRSFSLYKILDAELKVKDIKGAKTTADTFFTFPYEKAWALIKIAKSQVTRDFPFSNLSSDEAIETLAAAIKIAKDLSKKDKKKARKILKEATAATDTFKYLPGRVEVLCKIAIAQNNIGDVNTSKATFKKAKETASSISADTFFTFPDEKASALIKIAQAQEEVQRQLQT